MTTMQASRPSRRSVLTARRALRRQPPVRPAIRAVFRSEAAARAAFLAQVAEGGSPVGVAQLAIAAGAVGPGDEATTLSLWLADYLQGAGSSQRPSEGAHPTLALLAHMAEERGAALPVADPGDKLVEALTGFRGDELIPRSYWPVGGTATGYSTCLGTTIRLDGRTVIIEAGDYGRGIRASRIALLVACGGALIA
jgi:hypothetical protein